MSEALEISTYSKCFNSALSTRVIDNLKKTTSDTYKTKYQYFNTRRSITSESTILDSEHLFQIPETYGYVGNFWLQMVSDGSAVFDLGAWGIQSAIKEVKIEIGSKTLMTYSGHDLVKMINLQVRDSAKKDELKALSGSGDPSLTPMMTPLIAPGSNLQYWDLDGFDVRQPVWPIGAQNTPLLLRITLRAGSAFSKTNPFVMGSLKLFFDTFSVANDNIASIRGSQVGGVYYTWNYVKILSNYDNITVTDATEVSQNIDNVISQGLLNFICFDLLDVTTKEADMEMYDTEPIDALEIVVRGSEDLYIHDSKEEARLGIMKDFKVIGKYNGTNTGYGYFYPCALTVLPAMGFSQISSKGLDLNLNKPLIKFTCNSLTNSGTTHRFRYMAVYKALWNLKNSKQAEIITYP